MGALVVPPIQPVSTGSLMASTLLFVLVAGPIILGCSGCSRPNPVYCDEQTPCRDIRRTRCDLLGQLGLPRSCVTPDRANLAPRLICQTDATCALPRPICDPETLTCRGCRDDHECSRSETARFCNVAAGVCVDCRGPFDCHRTMSNCVEGSCHACTEDLQCPSHVCDEGVCVAPGEIVYIAQAGCAPMGPGTEAAPRCLPSQALELVDAARHVILIEGGDAPYVDNLEVNEALLPRPDIVTIVGRSHPVLTASSGDRDGLAAIVTIGGARHVRLRGLVLRGTAQPDGELPMLTGLTIRDQARVVVENMRCEFLLAGLAVFGQDAAVQATHTTLVDSHIGLVVAAHGVVGSGPARGSVSLEACLLRHNDIGVQLNGGEARLDGTEVSENAYLGIGNLSAARLLLDRSLVRDNGRLPKSGDYPMLGGIVLSDADFRITNSFIVRNGGGAGGADPTLTPARQGSGIWLTGTGRQSEQTFSNNTLADNHGGGAGVEIHCERALLIRNSVVWNKAMPVFSGACRFEHSNVKGDAPPPGAGNLAVDPRFVSETDGNYHLQADSPLIDMGTEPFAPVDDFDGELRPRGRGIDIGADEVR